MNSIRLTLLAVAGLWSCGTEEGAPPVSVEAGEAQPVRSVAGPGGSPPAVGDSGTADQPAKRDATPAPAAEPSEPEPDTGTPPVVADAGTTGADAGTPVEIIDAAQAPAYRCGDVDRAYGRGYQCAENFAHGEAQPNPHGVNFVDWCHCLAVHRSCERDTAAWATRGDWTDTATATELKACAPGPQYVDGWWITIQTDFYVAEHARNRCYVGYSGSSDSCPEGSEPRSRGGGLPEHVQITH